MIVLRACMTNNKTMDITGYDLELGRFDCTDGKTRTYDDFSYFIVPKDEMKGIVDFLKPKEKIEEEAKENEEVYTFKKRQK